MRVNIVTIGRELLEGRLDSNAAWLAKSLSDRGMTVGRILTVGDEPAAVVSAVRELAGDASAIVMTGGLGVTPDDLTRRALADLAGVPLDEDAATTARLRARYQSEGRDLGELAATQAHLPRGAALLPNPVGLAPGIRIAIGRATVYALPGVPSEMRAIAEGTVLPELEAMGNLPGRVVRVLSIWGMSEADVATAIAPIVSRVPGVNVSYLPTSGRLELVLSSRDDDGTQARSAVSGVAAAVRRRLGNVVFAAGSEGRSLEEVVGGFLSRSGLTLAVAESLTGGRIGSLLTRVPGSSAYVDRVIVTYSNISKERELGVKRSLMVKHGAVSAEVAEAMARGVRRAARTHFGLATTGIAGPTGATATKPVGLVYIAVASGRTVEVERFTFAGTRERIQARSSHAALDLLRRHLQATRG